MNFGHVEFQYWIAVLNIQYDVKLEVRKETGVGYINMRVICIERIIESWELMKSPRYEEERGWRTKP